MPKYVTSKVKYHEADADAEAFHEQVADVEFQERNIFDNVFDIMDFNGGSIEEGALWLRARCDLPTIEQAIGCWCEFGGYFAENKVASIQYGDI